MGQDYSQLYPDEPISQATQNHLEKRFLICPHPIHSNSQHFKLLHEKLTNKKYILRVLVTDESGKKLIEQHIFKKIANRSPFLVKLEHYIFEDVNGYCGMKTKCYLLFELEEPSTLREEVLKQSTTGVFTQSQILNAMENLMEGLLWLKYLGMPHGNINSYNIYCHPKKRTLILSDPWMAPEGLETIYPSPEKLQKILNKLDQYDAYASDVFSIGMSMLEIVKGGKLERIYKKNHTINYDVLIQEINKCPHPQLKTNLEYILLGTEDNRKEYLKDCLTKIKLKEGSSSATEKESIRSIGIGIKRILGGKSKEEAAKIQPKPLQQPKMDINPQSFQKPTLKFEHLNGKQPDEITSKPFIDVSALQRPYELSSATSNFTTSHVKPFLGSQRPPVYQAEPLGNNYSHISNLPRNNSIKFIYNPNQPSGQVITRQFSRQKPAAPLSYTPNYSPFTHVPQNTVSPFQISSQNPSGRPSSNIPISFYPITHTQPPNIFKPSNESFSLNQNYKPSFDHILHASSIKKTDLYDKIYQSSQQEINKKLFNDNSFQLNAISSEKPHSFTENHSENKHTYSTKLIEKYEEPQPIFLPQKAVTPMSIKRPNSQIQSNSSDMTDYVNKINQNINTFQIGISEAISNSIQNLQTKNMFVNKDPMDWKERDKETESRFSEFRPSQIMTSNLEIEVAQQKKEVPTADEKERKRSSSQADRSDIELTESQNNDQGDLKESQLFFKDSLVEEIKNINVELEEESKAHYTINSPANPIVHSQEVITSLNEINEDADDMPETPFRMRGTQLEILNNLTIPEQAPSEEESFDGQYKEPRGQYREQQYQNGGKYMGYVQNEKRNGKGTFYYRDGGYYEGNWRDNMMNGFGKLYYDSGLLAYEGQWYKDEFHGRGKVYNDAAESLEESFNYRTFEDHEKYWRYYDGDLSHDMKEGHGKLMLSNDQFYIGEFRDDKPHGKGTFHSKKGIVHGVWNSGKLQKEN